MKNLKAGPSRKRLKFKPWVLKTIEVVKVIGKCIWRFIVIFSVISTFIRLVGVTNVSKAQMSKAIAESAPVVEVIEVEEPEETHEQIIERLVADVESGTAGNGEQRKEYLGEYYDEVQSIIETKYKEEKKAKLTGKAVKATSGNKATYQQYAYDLVINKYGWSEADFEALLKLWERESNWDPSAHNKSSGAHGIPQSLPASKMASEGDDYMTNYQTQIKWGLKYIKNRYGTPTKAWAHSCDKGWY